ncbi:MAG: tryptophan--tRNA ligase [Candidatus Saccharibacteria bacterium]|nr:tryptophan--tRNA ligase [Candidatus Saccharibacteria bacterium]
MTKPVILTGIRANNDLHIGNYFGGLLPLVEMATTRAAEFDINLFIPDLHSFTTPIDHNALHDSILNNARVYAAAGLPLNNPSIRMYRQSYISAHSELTWILDCFTGFGEMSRMTQFKDKAAKLLSAGRSIDPPVNEANEEFVWSEKKYLAEQAHVSVGLFNYPVLMAADILLYNAKYVPVGDDQTQHLEFTRDIAERMNRKFGDLFVVPEPVKKQHEFFGKEQGLRIKDLADPTKKMSKSDETGKGVIFLTDAPEVARKKIMSATTDSVGVVNYDKTNQPGISNLLEILTLTRQANGRETALAATIDEFTGLERYGDLKKIIADEVATFLTNFQARLAAVDDEAILHTLERSEAAMAKVANATLLRVQRAVGLRR